MIDPSNFWKSFSANCAAGNSLTIGVIKKKIDRLYPPTKQNKSDPFAKPDNIYSVKAVEKIPDSLTEKSIKE